MFKEGDVVVVRDDADLDRVGLQREHIPPGEWTVLEPTSGIHGLVRVRHIGEKFAEWNLGEDMIEPSPDYLDRVRKELEKMRGEIDE